MVLSISVKDRKFLAYTEMRVRIRKDRMDSREVPAPPVYLHRTSPSFAKIIK